MATSLFHVIFLLAVVIATCNAFGGGCVTFKAAFNWNGHIFLVIGNEFIRVNTGLQQTNRRNIGVFQVRAPVDAAMMYRGELHFFKGSYVRIYNFRTQRGRTIPAGRLGGSFLAGGLDAAGFIGGRYYFFKGCNFKRGFRGNTGHLYELGLPCNVDATWILNGKMHIAKGGYVWTMDGQENVEGPRSLTNMMRLTGTHVCPNNINLQTAKKNAEKDYERQNDCVVIDAAIRFFFKIHLFNNGRYITFNIFRNEDGNHPISSFSGMPSDIDASLAWSGDLHAYYFKASNYYKIVLGLSTGPFGNTRWAPFFKDGIDAASNHNGKSYFFKGCEMVRYSGPLWVVNEKRQTRDVGLPCNVDAAYSNGHTMYVIKWDQVWTWPAHQAMATGPQPLNNLIRINSWKTCSLPRR